MIFIRTIEILAVAAAFSSIAYYALCVASAASFLRGQSLDRWRVSSAAMLPPISVLKPLKGIDPEMYQSLRTHCLQDYPAYEIICGVSDDRDPAIALVERLKNEFSQLDIRLLICRERLGANVKVSNLAQMARAARHEILIVNDGDIRVPPDYLRRVTSPLVDPEIGMVTCLYRGVSAPTLGSRLESLGIATDFCPGVLVARQIEGVEFGLGSTMALRRRDLAAIGGFESFADYLADDYELGNRISRLGLRVNLSEAVVETFLPSYSLAQYFRHQLRWGRTVRDSRFGGYLGLGLTFGLPWALLALILSRGAAWAWLLLVAVTIARTAVAVLVGKRVLRDEQVVPSLLLIPVRDCIALFVWFASFTGHTIAWSGESFKLEKGKLMRM
jgi:ceramide glucosyltransferase